MTNNEIIKALECCGELISNPCSQCPYFHTKPCVQLKLDALDLINRQKVENSNLTSYLTSLKKDLTSAKAEIERLETNNLSMQKTLSKMSLGVEQARAEAIKDFAERLKAEKFTHKNFGELVYVEDIDNLVKEMIGEQV